MKTLSFILNKTSEQDLKKLARILKIKPFSKAKIIQALKTFSGIELLFSSLDFKELQLLKVVYESKKPVTFGDIEKRIDIDSDSLEVLTNNLSKKLLLHSIKNRQLLNKKFDKVFPIEEFFAITNFTDNEDLQNYLLKLKKALEKNPTADTPKLIIKDEAKIKILTYLVNNGNLAFLTELKKEKTIEISDSLLEEMLSEDLITLYQKIDSSAGSLILLNEKTIISVLKKINYKNEDLYIHNNYYLLQNMLKTFDVISNNGLFLTKKTKFRLIDLKKIDEALLNLYDLKGKLFPVEKTTFLSLYLLHKLECLKVEKDTASTSLKKIKTEINNPELLTKKIIEVFRIFNQNQPVNPVFTSPFPIPTYEAMIELIQILHKNKKIYYDNLKALLFFKNILKKDFNYLNENIATRKVLLEEIEILLNFLGLIGIIKNKKNFIMLSDIGERIAALSLKISSKNPEPSILQNIYINPNLVIMIPRREVPSKVLYHLLTYTDVVKDDIVIQALVNDSSIAKANRRGASIKDFTKIIEKYSKTEIPQNFNFLLKEWSKQTVSLQIFHAVLLKSNQIDFIDEIIYNKNKKINSGVIERLTPNHVIIKKSYVDKIVKFAKDKKAIISLFEESSSLNE